MKRKSLPTGRDFLFVEGYCNENPGAFQSPRPLRGATCRGRRTTWRFCHFNPRAPCGARRDGAVVRLVQPRFQPTRPLRGATALPFRAYALVIFQPTRPLRGATDTIPCRIPVTSISIHAPLAGRDNWRFMLSMPPSRISTHAPLVGRDSLMPRRCCTMSKFQPTRPLRGATLSISFVWRSRFNFNPRAPCGARLTTIGRSSPILAFQPTRPLRGATTPLVVFQRHDGISTHAPLAGRDAIHSFTRRV